MSLKKEKAKSSALKEDKRGFWQDNRDLKEENRRLRERLRKMKLVEEQEDEEKDAL